MGKKKAPLIILSGGRIDWRGGGPPESADMAAILISLGIPPEVIIEEPNSLNTYEKRRQCQENPGKSGNKKKCYW